MASKVPSVLYLHGFASSPNSRKARFFAGKLTAAGLGMRVLDLERGNFQGLTLSGQLDVVEQAAQGEPVILIGSSLGGYLAAIYAAAHPEVKRLILLAPAFGFRHLWEKELGPLRMAEWRKRGTISVFHYGAGTQMVLGYSLMQDAEKYDDYPGFAQPALIFHGRQDAVVPIEQSEYFAGKHPHVRLVELQSDHELTGVLDEIWEESNPFLVSRTYDNIALREQE